MPQIDRAMIAHEESLLAESRRALQMERNALALIVNYLKEPRVSEKLMLFNQIKAIVPPGIYELHKSTPEDRKLYTVLGVGDHSEDRSQFLVACSAHYPPHRGNLAFRPLVGEGGFLTPVPKGSLLGLAEGYCVPRFKYIRQLPQDFEHFLELSM